MRYILALFLLAGLWGGCQSRGEPQHSTPMPTLVPALASQPVSAEQATADELLPSLNKAIRLYPHDARAHYDRGIVYAQLGQLEEALLDFDEAIRLEHLHIKGSPGRPTLQLARMYFERGKEYAWLREPKRALQDYDEAIRLNYPADEQLLGELYFQRAIAFARLGNDHATQQAVERAVAHGQDRVEVQHVIDWTRSPWRHLRQLGPEPAGHPRLR